MVSRRAEPGVIVRPATVVDLDEACDVYATVAGEGLWIGAEGPIDREHRVVSWRRMLEDPRETVFVAIGGDRVVGSAAMSWVGASELGMQVLPEYRRLGVGTVLVRACIDWAIEKKIHKIELKVWPHNEAALALYEKFGFEREGYLKRHYRRRNGELWDCVVMGLRLPPKPEAGRPT